jgi:hypothetical protein
MWGDEVLADEEPAVDFRESMRGSGRWNFRKEGNNPWIQQ